MKHTRSLIGSECAVWVRFPDASPASPATTVAMAQPAKPALQENQPPVARDQRLTTRARARLYVQLRFTDEDGPGPYSFFIVRGPAHGTLSGDNNDRYYTPRVGFIGTDRFTWRVNDGQADSKVAAVTITIAARGADRGWAFGSRAGGTYILWNRRHGIVFAGFGIDTRTTRQGIPHLIEAHLDESNQK